MNTVAISSRMIGTPWSGRLGPYLLRCASVRKSLEGGTAEERRHRPDTIGGTAGIVARIPEGSSMQLEASEDPPPRTAITQFQRVRIEDERPSRVFFEEVWVGSRLHVVFKDA